MTDHEIRGERTSLRPATDADLALLTRWLTDPEVYRWWDGTPATADDLRRRGYTGSRRPQKEPFIVHADREPVGYIQAWAGDADSGGIDLFLVPAARGRGLGPDAARALVRHLLMVHGWRRVTVDPAADNARAIRAWAKEASSSNATGRTTPTARRC
jgi:aminoglycoside 6'-N-acetyltransferase